MVAFDSRGPASESNSFSSSVISPVRVRDGRREALPFPRRNDEKSHKQKGDTAQILLRGSVGPLASRQLLMNSSKSEIHERPRALGFARRVARNDPAAPRVVDVEPDVDGETDVRRSTSAIVNHCRLGRRRTARLLRCDSRQPNAGGTRAGSPPNLRRTTQ